MATSLRKISEQVARLYARQSGRQTTKEMDKVEIRKLIIQALNRILKLSYKDEDRARDIPSCAIATYTNQAVSSNKCTLPAHPIRLPHDQGVWSVGPDDETSERYIPVKPEVWDLFRSMGEGGFEGIVGYYREGTTIFFTSSVSTPVRIKLLVADPNTIDLDDVLPVDADQEEILIVETLKLMQASGVSEA